jgi:hypothetical protein
VKAAVACDRAAIRARRGPELPSAVLRRRLRRASRATAARAPAPVEPEGETSFPRRRSC